MAFCRNCGKELPEGTKFCPECGAQNATNVVAPNSNVVNSKLVVPQQPNDTNKFGKYFGIILLVIALVGFSADPPILAIILSVAIIVGAVYCLKKKFRLKGFTIAALIVAILCLTSNMNQAKSHGLMSKSTSDDYAYSSTKELDPDSITEQTEEYLKTIEELSDITDQQSENEEVKPTDKTENSDVQTKESEPVENTEQAQPEEQTQVAEQSGGVDPELKAFLDSYEDFVDQYVVFMKKYNEDPNNTLSMLAEYSEMMMKYADFVEKIDAYDSDNMSTADYKYYIEVTTRCSTKMLDVY